MEINLGRVQGLSAYEVAVKKGYEGTEEEWLSSLKGEKGETGERGIQGERGEQGKQGEKGAPFTYEDFTEEQLTGLKGEKGDKGESGQQGEKGNPFTYEDFTEEQLIGLKGEKGDKGETGEQGLQGIQGERGEKGAPFTYADFTEEQLAGLKGEKGDKGEPGISGSYNDTEIKKQIEELEAENKRIKKDFEASMIEGQAEGEKITITDSVEARFKSFEIEGNSKQERREGYNLFNANNTTFSNRNNTGNPIIHSDNKIDITIMGIWARIKGMVNGLKPSTSYRISCNWKADTVITAGLWNGSNFSSEAIKKSDSADVYLIDTSNENGELSFYFYCNYSGEALTNKKVEFDDIMIVEGTEKKEYEAYGVSPTTEYPSEIKTVKENIHVKIVDENNSKEQNYSIPVQQEMLEKDSFIKVEGEWKEHHVWTKIESYKGEEITTEYKSTTGELTENATIYYKNEFDLVCTEEQGKALEEIEKIAYSYQDTTHIYSPDEVSPVFKVRYVKSIEKIMGDLATILDTINGEVVK